MISTYPLHAMNISNISLNTPILILIRFYQNFLSPLLGSNCRYHPTCSSYMYEAIEKYGAVTGCRLGVKRIMRCHPWQEGGYDPVP